MDCECNQDIGHSPACYERMRQQALSTKFNESNKNLELKALWLSESQLRSLIAYIVGVKSNDSDLYNVARVLRKARSLINE